MSNWKTEKFLAVVIFAGVFCYAGCAFAFDEIQLIDRATGDVYCVWMENGELRQVKGTCEVAKPEISPVIRQGTPSNDGVNLGVGGFIRQGMAEIFKSTFEFTKFTFESLSQKAMAIVPGSVKNFSAGVSFFVVQDVKSDFVQIYFQLKSAADIVRHSLTKK
jgi:hypothetical protein